MQIFILLNLFILFNCIFANYTSVSRTFHNNVLSRKRRFLIYPTGAAILLTASLVKQIIIKGPKGYNEVYELDIFFPLPDKVFHKNKKHKHPKPIPVPVVIPEKPHVPDSHELLFDHHLDHDNFVDHDHHHGELWMPDSGWTSDVISKLETLNPGNAPPVPQRRIWAPTELKPMQTSNYMPFPGFLTKKQQYSNNTNYYPTKFNRNGNYFLKKPLNYKQEGFYVPQGRSLDTNPKRTSKRATKQILNINEWDDYHGHRERRDIYENVLNSLANHGFTFKDCILRSICEAQHYLMPKGKSLMHDLFRVIFTLPICDDLSDPYSNAMRLNKHECYKRYTRTCPISLIDLFHYSDKLMANGLMY